MTGSAWHLGKGIWRRFTRKKQVDVDDVRTELRRCINTKRLTLLGLGRTVGVGIYILIGVATKEYAGPAVILSFLVAFLVTLLNALCFAEYASKNPKTGAQYTYMYEAVGEGVAFIVGWTSIVGCSTAFPLEARGWSGYLDSMFNHAIQNFTVTHIGHWSNGSPFSEYPDFPAVFIVLAVVVITSIGVNFSSTVNSVLTIVSGSVLVFITIAGLFYADFDNWFKTPGGFFPYGIKGVLKGSSACFYAFLGFDIIGMSSEETENPKKAVPRAIICELLIVTLLYLGVAVSFTLMIPHSMVSTNAPFPGAFAYHSVTWAKYIVVIGPLVALSNMCTLEMYTITRLCYSMSTDGLLFSLFSKVNKRTNVPVFSTIIVGIVVIGIVLGLDLKNVVSFMVIYSLLLYSFFACYLIIMRYNPPAAQTMTSNGNNSITIQPTSVEDNEFDSNKKTSEKDIEVNGSTEGFRTDAHQIEYMELGTENSICNRSANRNRQSVMGKFRILTESVTVTWCTIIIYISSFLLAILVVHGSDDLLAANTLSVYSAVTLVGIICMATLCIYCKDQRGDTNGYLTPLMPLSPVLCHFCNMVLLVSVAETGSAVAAILLAVVGGVIYLIIVITDVVKNGNPSISRDLTSQEQSRLLNDLDGDDTDFEEETDH